MPQVLGGDTTEGASIGAVNHLSLFARIKRYAFIEDPYRKVQKHVKSADPYHRTYAAHISQSTLLACHAPTKNTYLQP